MSPLVVVHRLCDTEYSVIQRGTMGVTRVMEHSIAHGGDNSITRSRNQATGRHMPGLMHSCTVTEHSITYRNHRVTEHSVTRRRPEPVRTQRHAPRDNHRAIECSVQCRGQRATEQSCINKFRDSGATQQSCTTAGSEHSRGSLGGAEGSTTPTNQG